jgi:hypothetical protein
MVDVFEAGGRDGTVGDPGLAVSGVTATRAGLGCFEARSRLMLRTQLRAALGLPNGDATHAPLGGSSKLRTTQRASTPALGSGPPVRT